MTHNDISKMPTQPEELLTVLKDMGIPYELYEHEAVFTVEESQKVDKGIPAHHVRNMYLRTKKKQNFLVTLSHDTPIDLKKLAAVLDVKNFSFGSPDRLMDLLGVYPGSVTPLSAMNAQSDDVTIILEKRMMDADLIAVHPLINTGTVTIKPSDLLKFFARFGHEPLITDLTVAG